MWFGSWAGINRFDGHNFVVYKSFPGDQSTLRSNRIDEITEDQAGFLWVRAYDNQIYRFDKNSGTFFAIGDILPKHTGRVSFNHVLLSDSGSLWLTTKDQGAYLINNSSSAKPRATYYGWHAENAFQLRSDVIRIIRQDKRKGIWIGTDKGLVHLAKSPSGGYVKQQLPSVFSKADFTAGKEAGGRVWFGTANGNLFSADLNGEDAQQWGVSAGRINSILAAKHGKVTYITTALGELIIFDNVKHSWQTKLNPTGEQLFAMFEDSKGKVWICPDKRGIVMYDPAIQKLVSLAQPPQKDDNLRLGEFKVFEDKAGRIWVGLKNEGFGYYDPQKKEIAYFYNAPNSDINHYFSNLASTIYYDRDGILWMCTADGGIEKVVFHDNEFKYTLMVPNSYQKTDNDVRAAYVDHENRLWLATKAGALWVTRNGIDQGKILINEPANGLGAVYCMIEDRHGTIWLGTKEKGMYAARPIDKARTHYKLTNYQPDDADINSLSGMSVYSIIEDRQGNIWVATFGDGLDVIPDPERQVRFDNSRNGRLKYPQDAYQRIRHLAVDRKGRVWIATTEGLLVADEHITSSGVLHFDVYNKQPGDKQSLGDNDVQFIFRDSRDDMWVCTAVGGINKVIENANTGKFHFLNVSQKDGLPSDYILSCIEDHNQNLWLATQNGLACLSIINNKVRNYDSNDGLPRVLFSESACAQLTNGDLLFGMSKGYLRFAPAQIKDRRINANLVITSLQANNQDEKITDGANQDAGLKFSYDQNAISIDYTVLDFRTASRQTYAYRLLGLDDAWQNNKNQRRVSYTNLSPGEYTFEVMATNESLYQHTPIKRVLITILPPPWRTWWAYLGYALTAIVIFALIRRTTLAMLHLRQHIAVEKRIADLKLSFFTNVAHELRTPLTLILNPIEEVARTENLSHQGSENIRIVRKNAERMKKFVNQLLDLRKAQNGGAVLDIEEVELISFIAKVADYFSDAARKKGIRLSVSSDEKEIPAWVDVEKLDIIVYNLLSNAIKYTPRDKSITVTAKPLANGMCAISVADEGTGIPPEHLKNIFELYYEGNQTGGEHLKGTGVGLALAKELAELHHGTIAAINNENGGLTILLELNIDKTKFAESEIKVKTKSGLSGIDMSNEEVQFPYLNNSVLPTFIDSDAPLVLLVEDNEDLSSFLSSQLRRCYRIETAFDGEMGLLKAKELLPDIIISDVIMPKMDGIKMLDVIKNDIATSHIPVVLLSARLSVESQIEGMNYGADLYITKPFKNEYLLSSIANLLKQRKKLAQSMIGSKKVVALNPGEITITSQDEIFLKNIIAVIEKQMTDQDLNAETLAASVSMSRSGFFKKFKSLTNMAPVEFIREMRLKRGKQFLDAGEHNIATIAYTVGFNNAKYFGTCFKDKYHITPSEYLKMMEKDAKNTKI